LIKTLGQHAPFKGEGFSANEQLDEGELVAVFAAVFMEDSRWTNMYQLHQAVNYSGWKIICACCLKRRSMAELDCQMRVSCTPLVRQNKRDSITKQVKMVKITVTVFHHNHPLTKKF
jgi:hypothetical protein